MTKEIVEIIKLVASEGTILTNGRAFGKTVYLGVNDKIENWHEITDAEYAEILAAQEPTADEPPKPEIEETQKTEEPEEE